MGSRVVHSLQEYISKYSSKKTTQVLRLVE